MRPRSRLLDKRSLQLPTIKEGSEETLRDPHHANASLRRSALSSSSQALSSSSSSSSQDYLLSICHLAHPTFPAPPGAQAPGSKPRGTGAGAGQTLGAADPLESLYGGPAVASSCWEEGGGEEEEEDGRPRRRRRSWGGRTAEGSLSGRSGGGEEDRDAGDQGPRRARANSVPRLFSPDCPRRRTGGAGGGGGVCPSGPQTPATAPPSGETPPVERSSGRPEEEGQQRGGRGRTEGAGQGGKPSLLSQWLSECKSVWRHTGVKVCLLPAIAET